MLKYQGAHCCHRY